MSDLRLRSTSSAPLAGPAAPAKPAPATAPSAVTVPGDTREVGGFPAEQVAALQAKGLLPANFAQADAWNQQSMWKGAQRVQSTPWIQQLQANLKVGDVILVHGHDPMITPMDGGAKYVHSAIVSSLTPPTVVEAWGPNASGQAEVRHVPFAEFVEGTRSDGYKLIRPTDDPATAEKAVQFAQQQVGKPYDWSFDLLGNAGQSAWYCSKLVYAAYAAGGQSKNPLAIDKNPQRDKLLALVQDLGSALRWPDPAKTNQLMNMIFQSPVTLPAKKAKYTTQDVTNFMGNQILAQDPVFKPLMKSSAGRQILMGAIQQVLSTYTKTWSLDPGAVRQAVFQRFGQLGFWDKVKVGFDALRGALHVNYFALYRAWKANKHGAIAPTMVSPQDIADGKNAQTWNYGSAS